MKATFGVAGSVQPGVSGGTTGVATVRAASAADSQEDLGESLGYAIKRRLLGPPLVTEQLREERLSKPLALGVLAPDGISSSAYGTEEILIELLKGGLGIAAFALILPLTGVVLFVMVLVVLSYREVVTIYTRAGGSYVVARENFGPRVAQVAAVALLIDYVVTVAVQVAAGTAAVASAIPALRNPNLLTIISICVVLLMLYGNLRGIREAGRTFAVPTYLFTGVMMLVIVVGLVREIFGNLPRWHVAPGAHVYGAGVTPNHNSLITFGLVFILLRAFANGGSSLTGIEAVSNAVSAFRPPEGINARRVLVTEGVILGTLVAGVSWLAHVTHATPYVSGVPTVISQEAKLVFGTSTFGHVMFIVVQAATALILYTGGNTSFNGFPFLASFVAEDAFLPRWLTKRGHRLVFSNGIIVLAVLSLHPARRRGIKRQPAGAVLRARRVHRVHARRVRHVQVPPRAQGTRLAAQARNQLRGRADVADRRPDLRGREVHRGRVAGPDRLRHRRAAADQAEPAVPDGSRGARAHQHR